ncbi:MAG: C-terminal binding protein [Casimicrobiaceae bacterium]
MTKPANDRTVLLTDYAWPDLAIEQSVLDAAGLRLVAGPAKPASPDVIESLAAQHRPAAIMTNWAEVTAKAIAACPDLQIVARVGVGLDNIAVEAATQRGIWVTNVPDYCVEEVSDHAVGLVLAWARGIVTFDREVRAGRWEPASARLRRVSTLTAGVLGYGRIGRATARKLAAFGCTVLACDVGPFTGDGIAQPVGRAELLARADVVIVHVPLTPTTHHLIDRATFAVMKPGAFLVNVSRGGVVDTAAMIDALGSGRLSGAALDVLEDEPQVPDALRERADVIITPHVAFSSDTSLAELRQRVAEEVVRVLRGEPPAHPCNAPRPASGH